MHRLLPSRLAAKLILALTLIVVLVEGALGFINARSQESQLLERMILGADQLSRSITSATWHAMLSDYRRSAYEVMQTIAEKQGIDRIRIFNKEGRVTFSTGPDRTGQVDKRAEACFACHAEAQPLVRVDVPTRARVFRAADGGRRLGLITPIYNERACSQAACHAHPADRSVLGVLDVTMKLDTVDHEVNGIRVRTAVVAAVQILLTWVLIVFFIRRLVDRPIRQLIAGTQAVSQMHLDRPVEVHAGGELGELAQSFDVMRSRLSDAMAELNQLTRDLEAKVVERTNQLQATQQRLAQADRLASLGQLAASVAHEINNPLAGVLNLAALMQRILKEDGIPRDRVEEFRSHLAQVIRETARVGRIVGDLLSFSRRSRPLLGRADLNAVVLATVDLLAPRLADSRAEVRLELDATLPATRGDASRLEQVVTNLLVNAADAMPGGGTITVRTRAEEGRAVLEVQDSGVGIAPEHLPRIFDPFFTTKEQGNGIGLGLAVVYGIVDSHGGEIEAHSTPGEGATFRVRLPVADEASRRSAAPEAT